MNGYDDDKEAARIATIIARQMEGGQRRQIRVINILDWCKILFSTGHLNRSTFNDIHTYIYIHIYQRSANILLRLVEK